METEGRKITHFGVIKLGETLPSKMIITDDSNSVITEATMSVQTRSDSNGKWPGTIQWPTVAAAHQAWQEDRNIWKISWTEGVDEAAAYADGGVRHRFRWTQPYRASKDADFDLLLGQLCPDYLTAKKTAPSAVFWFDEDVLTSEIYEVLRDVDFRAKYCTQ